MTLTAAFNVQATAASGAPSRFEVGMLDPVPASAGETKGMEMVSICSRKFARYRSIRAASADLNALLQLVAFSLQKLLHSDIGIDFAANLHGWRGTSF